jgi:hypothetical protein
MIFMYFMVKRSSNPFSTGIEKPPCYSFSTTAALASVRTAFMPLRYTLRHAHHSLEAIVGANVIRDVSPDE